LYVYFFAKGLQILRENGVLTFISPNKFLRAGYGENLRTYLSKQTSLETLIDFGDVQVFDATTYPFISIIRKHRPQENTSLKIFEVKDKGQISNLHLHMAQAETMPQSALKPRGWQLRDTQTLELMQKLETNQKFSEYVENTAYRGLTTGLNNAFEIDGEQKRRIIDQYPNSNEFIKPWLRGKNVNRWRIEWDDLYVIAVQNSGDTDANNLWGNTKDEKEAEQKFGENYTGIYEHLLEFEADLRKRSDQGRFWWELRACAYYSEFSKPKIIWAKYGIEPAFAYDRDGYYGGNTVFILPTDDLALLGILNSRVIQWYAQNTFNIVRGGYIEWIPTNVANLPIPNMDQNQKDTLTRLVRELIQPGKERSEVNQLEHEVNRLVYSLFNLNDGEVDDIAMIERDLQIDDNLKTADLFDALWKISGDTE
jgi:adenine-specific DNA-methyltransferase